MTTKKQGAASPKTNIFIVDDHPMMRQGLAQIIAHESDLKVCGEADSASEGMEQIDKLRPKLAIVDISLKAGNGFDLIKDIKARCPEVAVLVLSMHDESLYAERVLRAGACGYITKSEGGKKIMQAIRQVLSGQIYVSDSMSAQILENFSGRRPASKASPIEQLTDREFEVFHLIGQGLGTRQIAERLYISMKTVEVHRLHIKEKLNLPDAPSLMRYAVRWQEAQNKS